MLNARNEIKIQYLQDDYIFQDRDQFGLTHCGPVTQYCGGKILCKNPKFFTIKELFFLK